MQILHPRLIFLSLIISASISSFSMFNLFNTCCCLERHKISKYLLGLELKKAIEESDLVAIRSLCVQVPLNDEEYLGYLPLTFACAEPRKYQNEMVDILIKAGANINQPNIHTKTGLICATICRNKLLIRHLKQRGACLLHQDDEGNTALHIAIKNAWTTIWDETQKEIIELLIASKNHLEMNNKKSESPLYVALSRYEQDEKIKAIKEEIHALLLNKLIN